MVGRQHCQERNAERVRQTMESLRAAVDGIGLG
jgi:hypothetical protein